MAIKKKIIKVLKITLWVILCCGAGGLVGFAGYEHAGTTVRSLQVTVNYGQADILVTKHDIDSLILASNGSVTGHPLWELNTEHIEGPIRSQPYVDEAHVYLTNNGNVYVDIIQRQPILRIIASNYSSCYVDGHGKLLPLNPNYPARVLVASGYISDSVLKHPPNTLDKLLADSNDRASSLSALFRLAIFIHSHPFFRSQIEQIYVDKTGEVELIPKVGNHVILLGRVEDLEDKFQRLYVFYKLGLNKIGWNKYNVINIKYKNQVVCSKI
jgi:cell division protein FtsQ